MISSSCHSAYILIESDGLYIIHNRTKRKLTTKELQAYRSKPTTVIINTPDAACTPQMIPALTPYEKRLFKRQLLIDLSQHETKLFYPAHRPSYVIHSCITPHTPTTSRLQDLEAAGICIESILYAHHFDVLNTPQDQDYLLITTLNHTHCRCSFIRHGQLVLSDIISDTSKEHKKAAQQMRFKLEQSKSIRTDQVITLHQETDFYDHPDFERHVRMLKKQVVSGNASYHKAFINIKAMLSSWDQWLATKSSLMIKGTTALCLLWGGLSYYDHHQARHELHSQKDSVTAYLRHNIKSPLSLPHSLFVVAHHQTPFILFNPLYDIKPYATLTDLQWSTDGPSNRLGIHITWHNHKDSQNIKRLIEAYPHLEITYNSHTQDKGDIIIKTRQKAPV